MKLYILQYRASAFSLEASWTEKRLQSQTIMIFIVTSLFLIVIISITSSAKNIKNAANILSYGKDIFKY